MKITIRVCILALILVALLPTGLIAQNSLTQTVLSAAITQNASTMTVASATGFTASTNSVSRWAYLDKELVRITSVSGTTIGIARGQEGTVQTAHATNTVVFTYDAGNRGDPWQTRDYSGSCTRTLQTVQPIINIQTGAIYDCDANLGLWESVSLTQSASSLPYRTVSDAAYTAGLYDTVIHYPLLTTGRTLTLPAVTGVYGKIVVVRLDSAQTLTIAGSANQGVGTNPVGTTQTLSGAGAILRLVSVGGSWATW